MGERGEGGEEERKEKTGWNNVQGNRVRASVDRRRAAN